MYRYVYSILSDVASSRSCAGFLPVFVIGPLVVSEPPLFGFVVLISKKRRGWEEGKDPTLGRGNLLLVLVPLLMKTGPWQGQIRSSAIGEAVHKSPFSAGIVVQLPQRCAGGLEQKE